MSSIQHPTPRQVQALLELMPGFFDRCNAFDELARSWLVLHEENERLRPKCTCYQEKWCHCQSDYQNVEWCTCWFCAKERQAGVIEQARETLELEHDHGWACYDHCRFAAALRAIAALKEPKR